MPLILKRGRRKQEAKARNKKRFSTVSRPTRRGGNGGCRAADTLGAILADREECLVLKINQKEIKEKETQEGLVLQRALDGVLIFWASVSPSSWLSGFTW